MTDFLEISKNRYATKHYDPNKKISDELFDSLLEILRLAPSAVNVQPWHFYVGKTKRAKDMILPAIPDFNIPRIEDCSHFVVLCAKTRLDDEFLSGITVKEENDGRYPVEKIKVAVDEHRKHFSNMHKEHGDLDAWTAKQTYIAMTALLYGAASYGVDSTPIEGLDFDKLSEILKLKEKDLSPVAIVTLGYRTENDSNSLRPKSRLELKEICSILD